MLICYDNLADTAALSGGSWESTLGLARLQDSRLSVRARSTDTTATIIVDLGEAAPIKGVALAGHNLTVTADIRVTASSSSGFGTLTYDSGWVDAWPGITDQEEANRYPGLAHVCGTETLATRRYWKIEVIDGANPSGFLEFGRLFIGRGWSHNGPAYGWSLGFEDSSLIESSLGGAEYYDRRRMHRVMLLGLPDINGADYHGSAIPLVQVSGTTREVLVFVDPSDNDIRIRNGMLARLRTLSPIENPDPVRYSTSYEFKELIA